MICTYNTFIGALKCAAIHAGLGLLAVGLMVGGLVLLVKLQERK